MLPKLVLILLCCGLVMTVAAYVCSWVITGYRTFTAQEQTPADFGLEFESFTVKGTNGASLSCWFIPANDSRALLIASHGVADGKNGLLPCLLPFLRSGFSIVMYDLRHHGESTGKHCTLGYLETRDLLLLTDYVKARLSDGKPICYWGFSLGATISLLAAAERTDVPAVVARGPFESIRQVVSHYAWKFYFLPPWPLTPMALKFVEWRTGARVDEVNVRLAADKLQSTPILLIGSENDRQVPLEWLENIRRYTGPLSGLLVGPYGHEDMYDIMESDYMDSERAISFLAEAIKEI